MSEHVPLHTPSRLVQQQIYFRNVDILISSEVCISFDSRIALQQITAEGRGVEMFNQLKLLLQMSKLDQKVGQNEKRAKEQKRDHTECAVRGNGQPALNKDKKKKKYLHF